MKEFREKTEWSDKTEEWSGSTWQVLGHMGSVGSRRIVLEGPYRECWKWSESVGIG